LPKCLPKKLVQLSCVVIGLNDFHFNWFRHLLSRRTSAFTGRRTLCAVRCKALLAADFLWY
jgi:hypothetical protein